ncbi:ATP-binding protein [Williamsia sp. MIQD14]|uniref:ATP-binding protein n=1 Tax=Williamsia sp. MIQD14 TaxID=3425703 RepID=UPI003DA0ED38
MDTGAPITIRLIGVVSVGVVSEVHGERVVDPRVVGGPRCVEILAYLALHRQREVSTTELADLIWTDGRPRSWTSALRGLISKVRDAVEAAGIPGECVRSRGGNVRLLLPESAVVDLETARANCRPAIPDADGTIDHRAVAQRARAALAALSDEALVGVTGDWADPIRAECVTLRLRALDLDAGSSLETGENEHAVASAEALLAADPLREVGYRMAMRAYAALGDRAQALSVAARCRRVLAESLGVNPSADTEAVFADLLRDDADESSASRSAAVDEPVSIGPSTYPWLHIVGRGDEMRELETAIDAAAHGHGRFVVVSGESGTGKTTLATEAARRAREAGVEVVVGRCSENAATPYEPFVEAVTHEIDGRDTADTREWLTRHGADILRLTPRAARRFPDLMPASVSDDRPLVMEAVATWLTGDPGTTTVLLIDDLQWASAATLTVLRYVVGASAQSNLCVVATVRDDFAPHPELLATMHAAESAGRLHRIPLGLLTPTDVKELVDLAGFDIDATALHQRSNGLPMFIASLMSAHWRMPEEALPSSVADAVAQLERRLSDATVGLLHLCAVIGMAVSRSVLRHAARWFDPDAFDDDTRFAEAIDELMLRRFLLLSDDDSDDYLRLRHPLVRETLYATTAGAVRARMHSSVARALEEIGASVDTDDFVRLAYHLSRALDTDRPAAARYSRRAGENAHRVAAYEDAIEYFGDALDRMVPRGDSVARCEVLIARGRSMRRIRDPQARPTLFEAAAMARRLGELDLQIAATLANALEGILFVQIHGIDHERVDSLGDALAAQEASGVEDNADTARLLSQLVIELGWENDWEARRGFALRALAAARAVGDRDALAAVMLSVLIGLRVPQCADLRESARAELSDLMSLATQRVRDPAVAIWSSRAEVEHGDPDAALRILSRITEAQTARNPELAALVQYGLVGIDVTVGRLAHAEERIAMLNALPTAPNDVSKWGRLQLSLLTLNTLRGDFSAQVAERDVFVEAARVVPAFRPILALALDDVGHTDVDGAAALRAEAVELMDHYTAERVSEIPTSVTVSIYLATLARAAAVTRNVEVCRAVYERLVPFADQTIIVWAAVFGVVHHHLAHLAIAMGDLDRAAVHLADARREHRRRGYVAWEIETEHLALVRAADSGASVDPAELQAVSARAERIGATAIVRRVALLSDALGI